MTHKPLAEVRKTLRVDWYRCPIPGAKLRELSKRSDAQGFFQAGGHLALFIATGTITYLFWSQQHWLGFLIGLWLHGTVGSFFVGIAPHELGHGSVFRTKWLNKFFLYLFSLLSWWDPFDYASSHTYHHRYTLHPEGDREVLLPLEPSLASTFMLQMFTVNLFTRQGRTFGKGGLISTIWLTIRSAFGKTGSPDAPVTNWYDALHDDQPDEHRKSIWWSRLLLVFHGSILVIALATGLWVLPLLLTFFPFIANWLGYFVGLPQHCGLQDNVPDFRKCVRSMKLHPLVSFLYWRMGWHIEHHMYAGVPCYNLEKLYREIASDMPEPRTLVGAWREMRQIWARQKLDPSYQYDTPLPPTAKSVRTDKPDELESSIGELAPAGLRD
jgi:fatty acid desaturase